jgi:hypothetical protein
MSAPRPSPSPEMLPVWGGPTVATDAGVDLPACLYCRRAVAHSWPEHVAMVGDSIDPLAVAAGIDPPPRRATSRKSRRHYPRRTAA